MVIQCVLAEMLFQGRREKEIRKIHSLDFFFTCNSVKLQFSLCLIYYLSHCKHTYVGIPSISYSFLPINSSVLYQSTMQCRSLIRFLSVDIVIGFKGSSISNVKTIRYFPGQDPYPTWLCQMYIYHAGLAIQD